MIQLDSDFGGITQVVLAERWLRFRQDGTRQKIIRVPSTVSGSRSTGARCKQMTDMDSVQ